MTIATGRLTKQRWTTTAPTTTVDAARPLRVPGRLRHATALAGDWLGTVAIMLCIPVAILVVGMPIALFVRLLSWLVGAI